MIQEFKIGNLKLIQDEDGFGVLRQLTEITWEPIATFKYPEDAVGYFNNIIMQAVAYQNMKQTKQITQQTSLKFNKIPNEDIM